MRRLILGCGYLGRRVADAWRVAGDSVSALTRSPSRADDFRAAGIEPVVGDVTDPGSLAALPECDTVLIAVGFDRNAGPTKRSVYVDGLANALSVLAGKCDRVIYVSSSSVYGQQNGELVDEQSPCEPSHESGLICSDAESTLWSALKDPSRTTGIVLRLSGIYGPGRLLARAEAIRAGNPLPGPSEAWLNLIHVDDATQAVLASADRGLPGATYLVSDDRPVRRREYYEELARLLDAPAPQFDEAAVARHTRGMNKRCSNRRLREELRVELQFPTIEIGLPHALGLT